MGSDRRASIPLLALMGVVSTWAVSVKSKGVMCDRNEPPPPRAPQPLRSAPDKDVMPLGGWLGGNIPLWRPFSASSV